MLTRVYKVSYPMQIGQMSASCDRLACAETRVFSRPRFLFLFFFLHMNSNLTWVYCSCTVHVLKNIKNGSHDTIYTFKNYFATVFSVFSFQFSTTISLIQTHPIYIMSNALDRNLNLDVPCVFFGTKKYSWLLKKLK